MAILPEIYAIYTNMFVHEMAISEKFLMIKTIAVPKYPKESAKYKRKTIVLMIFRDAISLSIKNENGIYPKYIPSPDMTIHQIGERI